MRSRRTRCLAALCALSLTPLAACGDSVEVVKPTPRSAYRSTYPCELLTKAMAREILSIQSLRRVGAQSFDGGVEQCIWARGRYKSIPQIGLAIHPSTQVYPGRTVAGMQRRLEKLNPPVYRALAGLGDRALIVSYGRDSSSVLVEQDGRSFDLTLRLKQKPRSQPPPLRELEALARDISARYTRPPG